MRIGMVVAGWWLTASVCCAVAYAENETAAHTFENGASLLAKGDFRAALEAFKTAMKADPENARYYEEYSLLRRVLSLRQQLQDETDVATWRTMAVAVLPYYTQHGLHEEAYKLAQTAHDKLKTGETAGWLADAQLRLGKNEDAAALLSELAADERNTQTDLLRGIALARLGKLDAAKEIAAGLTLPKDCGTKLCFDAARLSALVGDEEKACTFLTCALADTPANQVDRVRADAKECKDFAPLAGGTKFAEALETKSKVAAGCGSTAACGKCPSKAKTGACPSEQKGEDSKEKSGHEGCPDHKK